MKTSEWSGHGLPRSTENVRTWESSWLKRLSKIKGKMNKDIRMISYGILVNRRTLKNGR